MPFSCQTLTLIKKFFGIESPSKVMANEVGRYIPEGIALGIEQNADAVTDAMGDLQADVLDAATDFSFSTNFASPVDNTTETLAILSRMDAMLGLMSRYFPEMAENDGLNGAAINRYLGAAYS